MEEWLLQNGYILNDGLYTNYKAGIKVILNKGNLRPNFKSLHGHSKECIELLTAIARFGLIRLL